MRGCLLVMFALAVAGAAEIPRGQIADPVACSSDPSQTYALYVPSQFTPDRKWSVIFAFDPRARGRVPVERLQAAAEKYGYIVAGSNNSRNGAPDQTNGAIRCMTGDVGDRFPIDPKRIYTTGFSGGSRVALQIALTSGRIAGVIAAGAGFPDSRPRKSVPFAIFGAAGTEDFNFLEMRSMERALRSPGRFAFFRGGHAWYPAEVATEAVEWLELQAMKSGSRKRDPELIAELLAKRSAGASALAPADACTTLSAVATDFDGLTDVASAKARSAELCGQKEVKNALKRARAEEDREQKITDELLNFEAGLGDMATRAVSVAELRRRLNELAKDANAAEDSADRRIARRVTSGFILGSGGRSRDPEYQKVLEGIRAQLRTRTP